MESASDSWETLYAIVVSVFARERMFGRSMQISVNRFAAFSSVSGDASQPVVPGKESMGLQRWTQDVIYTRY